MAGFSKTAFSTSAFSTSAFSIDSSGGTFLPDEIQNANASTAFSNFEICSRSGFRQLPRWHPDSQFVRDGYGEFVTRKSRDSRHPQDDVRSRGNDRQEGPQNPEGDNSFLAATIGPEDL
jgi:hypothetical protein